jgi:hypothetical protein
MEKRRLRWSWFLKAAQYNAQCDAPFAFVATNSICQGQQVPITWALLHSMGLGIRFAVTPFKWNNLASHNAGVTVVIVGVDAYKSGVRTLYYNDTKAVVEHINPYLTAHRVEIVEALKSPAFLPLSLEYGVYYSKSAGLILSPDEERSIKPRVYLANTCASLLVHMNSLTERFAIVFGYLMIKWMMPCPMKRFLYVLRRLSETALRPSTKQ